jgi:uncharacterized protein YyaL (SSP411 family)
MLYDNALLSRVYLDALQTGNPLYRRITEEFWTMSHANDAPRGRFLLTQVRQ